MPTTKKTAAPKAAPKGNAATKKTAGIGSKASRNAGGDLASPRAPRARAVAVDINKVPAFLPNPVESSLLASAQRLLADRALSYVMCSMPAREVSRFALLEMALSAKFTEAMEGPGLVMNAKDMVKLEAGRSWEQFSDLAWTSLAAAIIRRSNDLGWRPVVPDVADFRMVKNASSIVQKLGGEMVPVGRKPCETVREAWKIAQERLLRTECRLVTLLVLGEVLNVRGVPTAVMQEYRTLRETLMVLRNRAYTEVFATGILVGEEAYSELRAMARDRYGRGNDISHLTNVESFEPREISLEQNESLHRSIEIS